MFLNEGQGLCPKCQRELKLSRSEKYKKHSKDVHFQRNYIANLHFFGKPCIF